MCSAYYTVASYPGFSLKEPGNVNEANYTVCACTRDCLAFNIQHSTNFTLVSSDAEGSCMLEITVLVLIRVRVRFDYGTMVFGHFAASSDYPPISLNNRLPANSFLLHS